MSQHPTLKSRAKGKAHRSVWKRFERLKFLSEKDKWAVSDSVYGLEKIKLLKVKIKKEKAVEAVAEGAAAAAGAPAAAGTAAAPQAGKADAAVKGAVSVKGAAPAAKGAAAKPAAKEEAKGAAKPEKPSKK